MTRRPMFPLALEPCATELLEALRGRELSPATQGFQVFVQGELLCAPGRVYCAAADLRSLVARSEGDARTLALCIGTRHWDGHVREECVRQLAGVHRPWVIPFVIQLLGEYVLEIVEVIAASLPSWDAGQVAAFARENPGFMTTTRRRATSYWDCHHRHRFAKLRSYPAILALDAIEGRGSSG